jgi:hypothetical protein
MKNQRKILIFLLIPLLMGFSFEPDERDYTKYKPILMKKSDLEVSVFIESAKDFTSPGKIYLYGDTIFMVDLFTGIHVIDNQNPANPQKVGFIHIPGVVDLSIRNNVLYADNATDLVSIDISNFPQINILDRVPDVFPEHTPPDLEWIPYDYSSAGRPANTVIVAWVK